MASKRDVQATVFESGDPLPLVGDPSVPVGSILVSGPSISIASVGGYVDVVPPIVSSMLASPGPTGTVSVSVSPMIGEPPFFAQHTAVWVAWTADAPVTPSVGAGADAGTVMLSGETGSSGVAVFRSGAQPFFAALSGASGTIVHVSAWAGQECPAPMTVTIPA